MLWNMRSSPPGRCGVFAAYLLAVNTTREPLSGGIGLSGLQLGDFGDDGDFGDFSCSPFAAICLPSVPMVSNVPISSVEPHAHAMDVRLVERFIVSA